MSLQVEQQPDIQPVEPQPVTTDEIQEQPPVPSAASPQPELQTEQQPETQPAEPQPAVIDEIQNQVPHPGEGSISPTIEIKSIPAPQQQKEDDLNEQPSEFTQTTTEQSES